MAEPQHRIPGTRRRFIAALVATGAVTAGLTTMGFAVASQPPSAVMPPHPVAAASTGAPLHSARARPTPRATPVTAAVAADDSWTREEPAATGTSGPRVLTASAPSRLVIPSIGVDAAVHDLGLDAEGGLEVPQPGPRYDDAAWYRHSPTPGELGPAILLGHIDSAAAGPSVFFRLGEVAVGERIAVSRSDGSTAVFEVDAVHRYPKDDFPTDLVYGDLDHAGLRILTCGGAFDRTARSYVDNIVVFASLV